MTVARCARVQIATATSAVDTARMPIVITGHVDHGKSTIIGRLLADTDSLPLGKLEAVRVNCERNAKPFEYAFLLDALKDEQAQGITIDSARVFFKSARRHYVIIDAPGHAEFLKNMVTGAARAQAALLVIDAHEGIRENSRRHGYLLSMLGIRQIAVLINKMDLVRNDPEVFEDLSRQYKDFLSRVGVFPSHVIPVSGKSGENIAATGSALAWYRGPTVLEAIDEFAVAEPPVRQPFRMPVQGVYKFTAQGDDRRIVAGTIEAGRLNVGDEVVFHPSGKRSSVRSIEAFNRPSQTTADAGEAVGFTLTEQIYVTRGEMASRMGETAPFVATRIKASLFWLGRNPLALRKDYSLRLGTARVPVRVEAIHRVIDASALDSAEGRERVERNEVAECTLALGRPIAVDAAADFESTGRFAIVENFDICGGGIIREALSDNQRQAPGIVQRSSGRQAILNGTAASVLWMTGLSGAGKSTLAAALNLELQGRGVRTEFLDGDVVRTLSPAGFSRMDRDAHVRRVGFLASRLEHHGVTVICALISPYEEARQYVRGLCRRFIEIHVATPLEECERRDVKGLYARVRRGEMAQFTGIDDPYEPPGAPEMVLDTTQITVAQGVARIIDVWQELVDTAVPVGGRAGQ